MVKRKDNWVRYWQPAGTIHYPGGSTAQVYIHDQLMLVKRDQPHVEILEIPNGR